jgi:transposase InsO family protein
VLIGEIHAAREGYRRVYGVRKTWKELKRRDVEVGRDRVARLMRQEGLEGVRRGKPKRTTIPDETAAGRARDLQRDFTAGGPNEKWVADITYLRTWSGFCYLAFILDCYSRTIVGWQLATHQRTELVLDALEMANGLRRPDGGLIAHSDRGSQYTSLAYTTASTSSASRPRSARRATPTTTPWPRPGSRPSRASSSTGVASPASSTPSTRRCTGSASTTRSGCTRSSVTCRRSSTRS